MELDKQYHHLRNRVFKVTYSMQFSKQDAEDTFHDVCLYILEHSVTPSKWGSVITKVCGKARTNKFRKKEREISLDC